MTNKYNLQRFIDAQEHTYNQALQEIINGRKSSHWMWYIFPQYKGLGSSSTAQFYAIKSEDEAKSYFNHPILRQRLIDISTQLLSIKGKSALEVMGSPDYLKLKSSMTLFDAIQNETDVFDSILIKFYEGDKCKFTLKNLK